MRIKRLIKNLEPAKRLEMLKKVGIKSAAYRQAGNYLHEALKSGRATAEMLESELFNLWLDSSDTINIAGTYTAKEYGSMTGGIK